VEIEQRRKTLLDQNADAADPIFEQVIQHPSIQQRSFSDSTRS
jgi:hypothetical protein